MKKLVIDGYIGQWQFSKTYVLEMLKGSTNAEEVEGAEQEGVQFKFLSNPVKVNAENGRIKGLECIKMALGAADASGRRKPEAVKGSEFVIEVLCWNL